LNSYKDGNSVADVLKSFLRSLPEKILLPTKGIRDAAAMEDTRHIARVMADELQQIPAVNYFTLKRLFGLFTALIAHPKTRMTPESLGIVFYPTIHIPRAVIVGLTLHPEIAFVL